MPELPEVETIVRNLRPELTGKTVVSAALLWNRTLETPSPEQFCARVAGQTINAIWRRAKYLVFRLSNHSLIIHLRMSGDLWLKPIQDPPARHDRLLIELSDQRKLVFNDPRKFGRAWFVEDPQTVLAKLGPEPLDPAFTPADLYTRLRQSRRQMKPLLLDQGFLAGLGNIYTDEALHRAGIHPLRISETLSAADAERLLEAIRVVLQTGIAHNGASIDWVYRGGGFQNYFNVYDRKGSPCPSCGTPIVRTVVGQRSTHFCPRCQQ